MSNEQYEQGYLKADRDMEAGAIEDPFTASRDADAFLEEYRFERYNNGEDFREFKRGYANALREIALAQAPTAPRNTRKQTYGLGYSRRVGGIL